MKFTYKPRKSTNFLVAHCAATSPSMDIGVAEIRQWHMAKGWIDVGYHYVIRRDGLLETGRPMHAAGAHVRGHNQESVGICLAGGVAEDGVTPEDNFTPEQRMTLRGLIEYLQGHYPDAHLQGHRDFHGVNKACPSFDVREWFFNG